MSSQENDPLVSTVHSAAAAVAPPKSQVVRELAHNLHTSRALITQAGLLLMVLSLWYCIITTPVILFTGHPIFNSVGLLVLGQGILLVQPAPAASAAHKNTQGQVHGILNTVSVLSFVTGFTFIFYNKHLHGAQHYTTWHATFGLITYLSLVTVLLFGASVYWFGEQVYGSTSKAKAMYKYHRLGGYTVFTLAAFTVFLATFSDYNVTTLGWSSTVAAAGLLAVLAGVASQIQTSKIQVL